MIVTFLSTSEPEVAILQGAVLFGFDNKIIRNRKSKYIIGINVYRNWKEKKHKDKGIKVSTEFDGDQCKFYLVNLLQEINILNLIK